MPPILGNVNGLLGTINIGNTAGGVNWPGSSFDPETGIVYVQASNADVTSRSLREPPAGFSDIRYVSGSGHSRVARGPVRQPADCGVQPASAAAAATFAGAREGAARARRGAGRAPRGPAAQARTGSTCRGCRS